MSLCPMCGRKLEDTAIFCPGCGKAVSGYRNNASNTTTYNAQSSSMQSSIAPVSDPYNNAGGFPATAPEKRKKQVSKIILLICGIALVTVALAILLIHFLSGSSSTVLSKENISMADIVGTWTWYEHNSTYFFNKDGSWEIARNESGEQSKFKAGTWSYDNGKLTLTSGSGRQDCYQDCYYVVAYRRGYLYITEDREGDTPRYGFRIKRTDYNNFNEKEGLSDEERKLIGSWVAKWSKKKSLRIDFFEDGLYKEWHEKNGQTTVSYPIEEWFIVDDYLILIGDSDAGNIAWHYIKIDKISEDYIIGMYSWDGSKTLEMTRCD